MSEQKNTTKEYVVVFDQLDVHTGDFQPSAPGTLPHAVTRSYFRGDKVSLNEFDGARHLESGAVLEASDKRAKSVQPNEVRSTGVRRDPQVAPGALALDEVAGPVAGGEGAKRTKGTGTSLGTKADLSKLSVTKLKQLAKDHNVEVTAKDDKASLAGKLSKVKVDAAAGDETENPGQGKDESAPEGGSPLEEQQAADAKTDA